MQKCDICDHLQDITNRIAKTEYWVISLAPDQGYLGRCYVTLRKHKGSLASLSEDEWADFAILARKLEYSVTKSFAAEPSNWACMMNNAYQETPANPHVHWHFRPRYRKPYCINGITFEDPLFGYHYDRDQIKSVDNEVFQIIRKTLNEAFASE